MAASSATNLAGDMGMMSYIPGMAALGSFFANGRMCCGMRNAGDAEAEAKTRAARTGRPPNYMFPPSSADNLDNTRTKPSVRNMAPDMDQSLWIKMDNDRPQNDVPQGGDPFLTEGLLTPKAPAAVKTPPISPISPPTEQPYMRSQQPSLLPATSQDLRRGRSPGASQSPPRGQSAARMGIAESDSYWQEEERSARDRETDLLLDKSGSGVSAQPAAPVRPALQQGGQRQNATKREGAVAPHEDELCATETSNTDEIDEADFSSYAYALAQILSKGKDEVQQAIENFMATCSTPYPTSSFQSTFSPFNFTSKGPDGQEQTERLIIDITVEKRDELFIVSYISRCSTLRNIPGVQQQAASTKQQPVGSSLTSREEEGIFLRQEPEQQASISKGKWRWPGWCLDKKQPCIEVFVEDEDDPGASAWVEAAPISRVVDEHGDDTFLSARYFWDGESYDQDFGPDQVRRRGQQMTIMQLVATPAASDPPHTSVPSSMSWVVPNSSPSVPPGGASSSSRVEYGGSSSASAPVLAPRGHPPQSSLDKSIAGVEDTVTMQRPQVEMESTVAMKRPQPEMEGTVQMKRPQAEMEGAVQMKRPQAEMEGTVQMKRPQAEMEGTVQMNRPQAEMEGTVQMKRPQAEMEGTVQMKRPQAEIEGTVQMKRPQAEMEGTVQMKRPQAEMEGTVQMKRPPAEMEGTVHMKRPPAEMEGTVQMKRPPAEMEGTVQMKRPPAEIESTVQMKRPQAEMEGTVQMKRPAQSSSSAQAASSGIDRDELARMLREVEQDQSRMAGNSDRPGRLDPVSLQERLRAAEAAEFRDMN